MAWAIAWLPEGAILACLLVAVVTDVADRIIPNRLVLLVLFSSIVLRSLSGTGPLWPGLIGFVIILVALSLLAARNLIGWGDAKLIAAVSVAVPADRLLTLLFAVVLAGGLLSCVYLVSRFILRRAASPVALGRLDARWRLGRVAARERARIVAGEPMPYAVAIFGGVLYTLITG
jgi:prepilin peptidase CpaA